MLSEDQVSAEEQLSVLAARFAAVASLHDAVDEAGVVLSIQEVVAIVIVYDLIVLLDVYA